MAGGSIEKLKEILGHYSVIVTERYAHLLPDLFPASDPATISLDMSPERRDPPPGPQSKGARRDPGAGSRFATTRNHQRKTGAAL